MSRDKKDSFIKKYLRKRQRINATQHAKAVHTGAAVGSIASAIPFLAIDPTGISLLFSWSAYTILGAVHASSMTRGKDKETLKNSEIRKIKFEGKRNDIWHIASMQCLIAQINEDYKTTAELPENIKTEIALHLKDIEPLIKKVKIFQDDRDVKDFNFVRPFKHPISGRDVIQLISSTPADNNSINTADVYPIAKLTAPQLAKLKKERADKKRIAEFNAMAKRIEELERKLSEKETPKPVVIDKPKRKNEPKF